MTIETASSTKTKNNHTFNHGQRHLRMGCFGQPAGGETTINFAPQVPDES
jgi:hypothetical protein